MKATYFFVFAIVVVASAVRAEAGLRKVQTAEIEKAKRDRKWLASMGGSFAMAYIDRLSPDGLKSLFAGTTIDISSVKRKIEANERLGDEIHNIGLREATVGNINAVNRLNEQKRALKNELKTTLENSLNVANPVEEEEPTINCDAELTQQARDHKLALDKEIKKKENAEKMIREALSELALAQKASVEQTKAFKNAFAKAEQECAAEQETAKAQCAAQLEAALNAQAEEFNTAMEQVQEAAKTALMEQKKEFERAFAQAQAEFAAQQARPVEEFEVPELSLSGESALQAQKREFCYNFQNDPDRLTRICSSDIEPTTMI